MQQKISDTNLKRLRVFSINLCSVRNLIQFYNDHCGLSIDDLVAREYELNIEISELLIELGGQYEY